MSEYNICPICGGYIGNTILYATVTTTSTVSAPPITFCPGHKTTDTDLVRLVGGSGTVTYTLPATGEQGYKGFAVVGEPGPEPYTLPPGSSVYPQHEEIIDTTSPDFAKNFKGFINKPTQQMQQETLWEIAQEVAEGDSTYAENVGFDEVPDSYYCPFPHCDGAWTIADRAQGKPFQHSPECIVTKARTLMEWRKVRIEVKKDGE